LIAANADDGDVKMFTSMLPDELSAMAEFPCKCWGDAVRGYYF
jgi:hypothetical protein